MMKHCTDCLLLARICRFTVGDIGQTRTKGRCYIKWHEAESVRIWYVSKPWRRGVGDEISGRRERNVGEREEGISPPIHLQHCNVVIWRSEKCTFKIWEMKFTETEKYSLQRLDFIQVRRLWNKKRNVFPSHSLAAILIRIHEINIGWVGEDADYKLKVEVIFCPTHSSAWHLWSLRSGEGSCYFRWVASTLQLGG